MDHNRYQKKISEEVTSISSEIKKICAEIKSGGLKPTNTYLEGKRIGSENKKANLPAAESKKANLSADTKKVTSNVVTNKKTIAPTEPKQEIKKALSRSFSTTEVKKVTPFEPTSDIKKGSTDIREVATKHEVTSAKLGLKNGPLISTNTEASKKQQLKLDIKAAAAVQQLLRKQGSVGSLVKLPDSPSARSVFPLKKRSLVNSLEPSSAQIHGNRVRNVVPRTTTLTKSTTNQANGSVPAGNSTKGRKDLI